MNREYEIALLMRKYVDKDNVIHYFPVKVVEGYYDTDSYQFVEFDGTGYEHIIYCPDGYGFCARDEFSRIKKEYPLLNSYLLKKLILHKARKYYYNYIDYDFNNDDKPVILFGKKQNDMKKFMDDDILDFYLETTDDNVTVLDEADIDIVSEKSPEIDIKKLYQEISDNVIAQEEAIKKILSAIWKHYNNFSDKKSRNILINGNTGVGKTEIFRILTKLINVPCVVVAATDYSATGYVGKTVTDMIVSLINKANGDVKLAERGILIIDEIDKLSETNKSHSQINQKDVQEALLKILEDGEIEVKVGLKNVVFDASKLMVVGMGSWTRIDLTPEKVVGFEKTAIKKSYKDLTKDDLIVNGMLPDLIGRFSTLVQMNDLDEDILVKILKSKNSVLLMNKSFYKKQGIDLKVTEDALKEIAKKAYKEKTGARALDEILENTLSIASFEIASNPDKYKELIIDGETIKDNKKYVLKYNDNN